MTKAVRPQRKNLITHTYMIMRESDSDSSQSQFDSEFNSESNSNGSDLFIQLGHYHFKRTDNGEVDQEFTVPIIVESMEDFDSTMNQLKQKILDGEIQITIEKHTEYWDDIPSPSQEDLEAAIQIMDQIQLPDPEVPRPQKTAERSWDSD